MRTNKEIRGLAKSFGYAFKGIIYCINNERNMRIHIVTACFVTLFSFFYKTSRLEFAVIMACIVFVISAEMINTAVETLVNLQSPSYNNLARIAKDVAAGAVLVGAVGAAVIGGFVFFDAERLTAAITLILSNPIYCAAFVLPAVFGIWFIFHKYKLIPENYIKIYNIKKK